MIITHKLQPMDLTHKQNTIRVDVVQDDKYSRDVEFTLTENGVAWQIPDGTTAVVRYKKPDGTGGNYDTLPDGSTAYQINGNVLTVALAPQVCTVSGSVQLSVGLIHGNAEINTFTVNIVVHPNPGAEYQSEDYIRLSGAVPNSGWTPNMYLGTDASGNVVEKEGTSGGGGTSGKDGVGIQSVGQTTTSTEDGGTNIVTVTKTDGTSSTFQVKNGSKGSTGPKGTDGKSAYQYAQDGGYTGTESEFAAKMAEEMPDKLPNPNALTFTGAVTGSYDGSAPLEVAIPSGGGSSDSVVFANDILAEGTVSSDLAAWGTVDTGVTPQELRAYKSFAIYCVGITGRTYATLCGQSLGQLTNILLFEWEDSAKTILRLIAADNGKTNLFNKDYREDLANPTYQSPFCPIRTDFRNATDENLKFITSQGTTTEATYQVVGWMK